MTEPSTTKRAPTTTAARAKAYLVHAYTASTMVILLGSTALLLNDRPREALFVMLLNIVIDATDGMLARRYKVKQHAPEFDGRTMDDCIDYVAYVFLPIVFMLKQQMLLAPAVLFGAFPLISSAFGFARVDAKIDDEGFFVGFPSYWNVIVAYLYLTGSPPWLNTLIIMALTVMVFVPTRYIYITRFPRHRRIHFVAAALGLSLMVGALFLDGPARVPLVLLSLIYPVYYTVYSFVLDRRARRA